MCLAVGTAITLDLGFLREAFVKAATAQLGTFDMDEYVPDDDYGDPDAIDDACDEVVIGANEEGEPRIGSVLLGLLMAYKKKFDVDYYMARDVALLKLAGYVEQAYKKFLVVKTVEAHAKAAGNLGACAWTEKCMASTVIDVMWHCQLLRPQHYFETCSALLGRPGVIDHDPGYISPKKHAGSDLTEKIDTLFSVEMMYCSWSPPGDRGYEIKSYTYFDPVSYVLTKKQEEWLDDAFEDLIHGDDMECG